MQALLLAYAIFNLCAKIKYGLNRLSSRPQCGFSSGLFALLLFNFLQ